VSILFTVFGGPGIGLVFVPWWLTRFHVPAGEPDWQFFLAGALILIGLIPLLESIYRFIVEGGGTLLPTVPTESLVVTGFYRYVRNPMYLGVVVAATGQAVLFPSRDMVMYVPLLFAGFSLFVLLYEEPTLNRRYHGKYALYKRNVPRWWPRWTPWDESEEE
jgi:protein-S-isoprenylcysteine O-methyltransferase Ste14